MDHMKNTLHAVEEAVTYTVEETAILLKIGRNSAYEGVRTGEIPSLRIGRRYLVPHAALFRMLENTAGASAAESTSPDKGPRPCRQYADPTA